jgi:hypothetical protein
MADCEAATVESATVMAGIRGDMANRHPREELVVVLVSAQAKPCDCWTPARISRFCAGSKKDMVDL